MSGWSRFNSQFRETDQERRERLRASYKRHLAEHAQKRREECVTCPPADADPMEGCDMDYLRWIFAHQ